MLTWKSETTLSSGSQTFDILLTNSNDKPLSGKVVKLTVDSKNYTATTNSKGYAVFKVSLSAGSYAASYSFEGDNLNIKSTGSTKLTIKDGSVGGPTTISIANILIGAANLKAYYEKYGKLSTSVIAAGHRFTVPEFLYLMSQAIYQLGNSILKQLPVYMVLKTHLLQAEIQLVLLIYIKRII